MKITAVEAIPLWADFADVFGGEENVPRHVKVPAFGMLNVPLGGQGGVLVRIHTDSGLVGVGETMGRPGARGHAALIDDVLAPILIGQNPLASAELWRTMSEQLRFAPYALSGVDIALWDIRGLQAGSPVYQLLGGPFKTSHACYASPIPYHDSPKDSADQAEEFLSKGFKAVKLKIGRGVGLDLEHVAEVRGRIGPDFEIMVDANGAYDQARAVRLGRGLERIGVTWLEEPVHPEHVDDLAATRRKLDVPIATGEWLGSIHQFRSLLRSEAADVVMPNITRCGGMTGMVRIAELAELHNVQVAPHGVGMGIGLIATLHAMSGIPNVQIYEYNQLINPLRHEILDRAVSFSDGKLHVPDGPGLGMGLNEATVARYDLRASKAALAGGVA